MPFEAQDESYQKKFLSPHINTSTTGLIPASVVSTKEVSKKIFKSKNISKNNNSSTSTSTSSTSSSIISSSSPIGTETTNYTTNNNPIHSITSIPLLIGASPDGLILHPDGSTEILEIKCVSPFENKPSSSSSAGSRHYNNHKQQNTSKNKNTGTVTGNKIYLRVTDRSPPSGVPSWHIPQLQLEILCAGPKVSTVNHMTL